MKSEVKLTITTEGELRPGDRFEYANGDEWVVLWSESEYAYLCMKVFTHDFSYVVMSAIPSKEDDEKAKSVYSCPHNTGA